MKHSFIHIPYNPGCPIQFTVNDSNSREFHQHSGLEIIWLLTGKLEVTIDQKKHYLHDNDIFLINHFELHRVIPKVKNTYFIQLHIDSIFISNYNSDFYQLLYDLKSFKNSKENQNPYDVIRILLSQLIYLEQQEIQLENIITQLLEYLSSRFSIKNLQMEKGNNESNKEHGIVQQVLNSIEQDFKRKITLNEIAQNKHYNSSYLSDLFGKSVGISFLTYVLELRIRYSLYLLKDTEESITNIALFSGFSDDKSYYKAIKDKFLLTPTQLRKKCREIKMWGVNELLLNNSYATELINHFVSLPIKSKSIEENIDQTRISLDIQANAYKLKQVWNKIINIGSANTLLNQNVREQIEVIQEEIKFEYIRFEGVFNQEMEVVQKDRDGLKFNWKFVNNILDYIQSIQSKPFICLSYMPPLFASMDASFFNYQGNTSPPKEMSQWLSLVQSFMMNCINRYGHDNVSKWYFQIWTEFPVQDIHWSGTLEQYFEFYKQTALLMKGISASLKVGPASENFHAEDNISEGLLKFCKENAVPIDFYSCNIYHNRTDFNDWPKQTNNNPVDIKLIPFKYQERDHTKKLLEKTNQMLQSYYQEDVEFIVTRWNFSWDVTNLLHDTAFMAPFIIDNMLHQSASLTHGIGYLTASDILHEWDIDNIPFFGGNGLINTEGIKKSAYYGFVFLSKLGSTVVAKGANYIITRHGEDIQILAFNPTYPNQLFVNGDQTEKKPYRILEESNHLLIDLHLKGIYGTYKCKHYSLSRSHGSAYDEWVRMGEFIDMDHEEMEYLKKISIPSLTLNQYSFKGDFHLPLHVPVLGVECIVFKKLYN